MLLVKENACLLIVDVQTKLTPLVLNSESLVEGTRWLMTLAKTLNIPILVSEQYPKGLGKTVTPLAECTQNAEYMEKVHFSCAADPECLKSIARAQKNQIVIAGIETHVCILQTALGLIQAGFDVYVVADLVSARKKQDHTFGLKRIRQAGGSLVTREMVFFEWVHKAGTPEFKTLSTTFLK